MRHMGFQVQVMILQLERCAMLDLETKPRALSSASQSLLQVRLGKFENDSESNIIYLCPARGQTQADNFRPSSRPSSILVER